MLHTHSVTQNTQIQFLIHNFPRLSLSDTHTNITSLPRANPNFLTHFTAKSGPSIFEWLTLSMWQFGHDYAEKRRRMGPGGRFCCSDNAPQDGDSAGVAGAAHSRCHPAPNVERRHPPRFCHQQPSNGSRRRSRPVHDIRQPIYHLGLRSWLILKRWESVVAPSTHLSSRGEMGAEKLPAPKCSPLCPDTGP